MQSGETQLVNEIQKGESAAAEVLVRLYGDRLLRSAYLLCGNETDAKDLVQETFIQAVRCSRQFRATSSVFTWLYGILLNVVRHYIRGRNRKKKLFTQRLLLDKIPAAPEPGTVDSRWASAVLTYAIHQLPSRHREVIVLRFLEGMRLEEVAGQLGVTLGTAKSRIHYALRRLRKKLPVSLNLFEG
jgi:RNA polymerase sigma-70 factor (ECF subfamily)